MSSPNEKLYDFLASQVAPYKGALPDMWAKFLARHGFSNAPIQKGIHQYLGSLGYTGIFSKRWAEWYKDLSQGTDIPSNAWLKVDSTPWRKPDNTIWLKAA